MYVVRAQYTSIIVSPRRIGFPQCSRIDVQHPTAAAVENATGVQQVGVAVKHVEHLGRQLLLNKCSTTVQPLRCIVSLSLLTCILGDIGMTHFLG